LAGKELDAPYAQFFAVTRSHVQQYYGNTRNNDRHNSDHDQAQFYFDFHFDSPLFG
jgi:hypothetical protein